MRRWFKYLDRILRGEATRPAALRAQTLEVPVGGLSLVILLLALVVRRLLGALRRLPGRGPLVHAVVVHDAESPGAVLSDAGRDLSLAVRFQRPGRLAAEPPRRPAASDRRAGGEPGGAGFHGADRGVLLLQHDELAVHGAAERAGLRGLRTAGHGLPAANAATPERRAALLPPPAAARPGSEDPARARRADADGPTSYGRTAEEPGAWTVWRATCWAGT